MADPHPPYFLHTSPLPKQSLRIPTTNRHAHAHRNNPRNPLTRPTGPCFTYTYNPTYERKKKGPIIMQTIEVCTDCYYAHHGLDGDDETPQATETWSLIPENSDVSDNTCSNHDGGDETACTFCDQPGYEDGLTTFTWSPCEACGSHLGGARFRMAVHS